MDLGCNTRPLDCLDSSTTRALVESSAYRKLPRYGSWFSIMYAGAALLRIDTCNPTALVVDNWMEGSATQTRLSLVEPHARTSIIHRDCSFGFQGSVRMLGILYGTMNHPIPALISCTSTLEAYLTRITANARSWTYVTHPYDPCSWSAGDRDRNIFPQRRGPTCSLIRLARLGRSAT